MAPTAPIIAARTPRVAALVALSRAVALSCAALLLAQLAVAPAPVPDPGEGGAQCPSSQPVQPAGMGSETSATDGDAEVSPAESPTGRGGGRIWAVSGALPPTPASAARRSRPPEAAHPRDKRYIIGAAPRAPPA